MSYLSEMFSLAGRGAIVTGAARGNGAALAAALAEAGASVLLVDREAAELEAAVSSLLAKGLTVAALACDVTDASAPADIVAAACDKWGRLDVLVNNAGVTRGNAPDNYTDEDWELTHAVNLRAPFRLSVAAARAMAESGGGSIINITSLNAELAFPGNPAYVAFKGALKQLTKSMALDLGDKAIRVNAIGPGYMKTAMTEQSYADPERRAARAGRTILGRWGEPEDLAGAVIFLASDASAYVTGQDIYVDGGWLAKGL